MFTSILNRRQQHRPTLKRHKRRSRPEKGTKLDCRRKNRASKFASGCEFGDTNAVLNLITKMHVIVNANNCGNTRASALDTKQPATQTLQPTGKRNPT